MTDLTTPGEVDAEIDNISMAHAIGKAGGHDGYVVNGVDLAGNFSALDNAGINSFEHSSDTGLEFTVDGGEAFVWGWLARDVPTTVQLPASSTVTVAVGFNLGAILSAGQSPADSQNILVGVNNDPADSVDFADGRDPYLPLYEVSTDSVGVTSVTDVRQIGRSEANPPWSSTYEHPDTLPGPLTITSSEFRDHLFLDREGIGTWAVTPTSRDDGGLLFELNGGDVDFNMTDSGHIIVNDDFFVKTDRNNSYTIVKDGTDGPGIINFKTQ